MAFTIISGGQTGVDRGALDAALGTDALCDGWCPEGRMADDGIIPEIYPLKVLEGSGYRKRTKQNVLDSDATLIIYFDFIYPQGGTEQTLLECIKAKKPYLLIDGNEISVERAADKIIHFVRRHKILRLNVAGPKANFVPQAHNYAKETLSLMIQHLKHEL